MTLATIFETAERPKFTSYLSQEKMASSLPKFGAANWGISDDIAVFKARVHMHKKDDEAYVATTEDEIERRQERLHFLRHNNVLKERSVWRERNKDKFVIREAVGDNKRERLGLENKSVSNAVLIKDERAICAQKKYDRLNSRREKLIKQLREINEEVAHLQSSEARPKLFMQIEQQVNSVENALDKALIKYHTAEILGRKYREIITFLKEDAVHMPGKLNSMEKSVLDNKAELAHLTLISENAFRERDRTKAQLIDMETGMIESRRYRETKLNAVRKQADSSKQQGFDKNLTALRETLFFDNIEAVARPLAETQSDTEQNHRVLKRYEDALQKVKDATKRSNIDGAVTQLTDEQTAKYQLDSYVDSMIRERDALKEEVKNLKLKHEEFKFTGTTRICPHQLRLDELTSDFTTESKRQAEMMEKLQKRGEIIAQLRLALPALADKLRDLAVPEQEELVVRNQSKDPIFYDFGILERRFNCLLDYIRVDSQLLTVVADRSYPTQFKDYIENNIMSDRVRINIAGVESEISDLMSYDGPDESAFVTANDIKMMGQLLYDSKTKPKKRKGKK